MSQFGNPCFGLEQQLANCSAIAKINSDLMAAHCWKWCSSILVMKKFSKDICVTVLPPHLLCNDNYCKQSTLLFKLNAFQTVRMNSDSHTFLEQEMYSTFQSWQPAPRSPQPQLKNIHREESQVKRGKTTAVLKILWDHRQPLQVKALHLESSPVLTEWLYEKPTWLEVMFAPSTT